MASAEVQVWGDNEQRIRTFQACFPASTESFLKPGRILVGEGVLLKQCRKKLKPRQVILFNDCVLYAVVVGKKKYGRPIMLNVNEMEATKVAPLRIVLRHPAQSITLQTSTEQEAADWEQHINMCIASQPKAEKQRPFAALWTPDVEVDKCMVCNTQKFSTFNRRHHCRRCGRVCCGACSNHKAAMMNPQGQLQLQRICKDCFKLDSNRLSGSPSPMQARESDGGSANDDARSNASSDEDGEDAQVDDNDMTSNFYVGDQS